MKRQSEQSALTPTLAEEAAARGNVYVRVMLPRGPCWCRIVGFRPARGKRAARLIVDVTGISRQVVLEDVLELRTGP